MTLGSAVGLATDCTMGPGILMNFTFPKAIISDNVH